ncbi:MAG TPA: hypothetical protein VNM89_09700 [Solirubrobacterales bacterium]|nr:hypothetical protein [Solirubrobacterales bacterium]
MDFDSHIGEKAPKFGLKRRKHPVDDALSYLQEREKDGPTPDGSRLGPPVENYLRGDVGLHIHTSLKVEFAPEMTDYCVLLYVAKDGLDASETLNTGTMHPELGADAHGGGHVDEPMLVDIRQLLQTPKGRQWRVLPSVIRLKPLNACLCAARHSFDLVSGGTSTMPPEFRSRGVNREGRGANELFRQRIGVSISQGIGELVEGGAIVEDAIPNDDAQFRRRVLNVLHASDQPPFLVQFSRSGVEVRPAEAVNHLFESFQVFLGPVELE